MAEDSENQSITSEDLQKLMLEEINDPMVARVEAKMQARIEAKRAGNTFISDLLSFDKLLFPIKT
jgi:hypothetical protein